VKVTKGGGWVYGKGSERSLIKILGRSEEGRGICKGSRVVSKIKCEKCRGDKKTLTFTSFSNSVFMSMSSNIFSMLF